MTYKLKRNARTRLKIKTENNSIREAMFYQSEWDKINSSWIILVFHFMCIAANASELFYVAYLANTECFL